MIGSKSRFSLMVGTEYKAPQPAAPALQTEATTIVDENGNDVELELGPEGMPLEKDKFVPNAPDQGLPPRERIESLLKEMLPCRSTLLAILRACAEPVPASQVIELVNELQRHNRSVFGPEQLCALLRRAGGLELVTEQGEPYPEGEQEPKRVEADERALGTGTHARADEGELAEAQGEPAESEAAEGDQPAEGEAIEAAEPPVAYWRSTPDGLEVAAADDPVARIHAVLEDEALYLPIFKCVLSLCAREQGAKTPALGAAVNGHPLVQKPRLFVMHFIDRLEKAGGLEWVGTWSTTEAGLEVLGSLGDVEDIEVAANIDDARAPEPVYSDIYDPLEG